MDIFEFASGASHVSIIAILAYVIYLLVKQGRAQNDLGVSQQKIATNDLHEIAGTLERIEASLGEIRDHVVWLRAKSFQTFNDVYIGDQHPFGLGNSWVVLVNLMPEPQDVYGRIIYDGDNGLTDAFVVSLRPSERRAFPMNIATIRLRTLRSANVAVAFYFPLGGSATITNWSFDWQREKVATSKDVPACFP